MTINLYEKYICKYLKNIRKDDKIVLKYLNLMKFLAFCKTSLHTIYIKHTTAHSS